MCVLISVYERECVFGTSVIVCTLMQKGDGEGKTKISFMTSIVNSNGELEGKKNKKKTYASLEKKSTALADNTNTLHL